MDQYILLKKGTVLSDLPLSDKNILTFLLLEFACEIMVTLYVEFMCQNRIQISFDMQILHYDVHVHSIDNKIQMLHTCIQVNFVVHYFVIIT